MCHPKNNLGRILLLYVLHLVFVAERLLMDISRTRKINLQQMLVKKECVKQTKPSLTHPLASFPTYICLLYVPEMDWGGREHCFGVNSIWVSTNTDFLMCLQQGLALSLTFSASALSHSVSWEEGELSHHSELEAACPACCLESASTDKITVAGLLLRLSFSPQTRPFIEF